MSRFTIYSLEIDGDTTSDYDPTEDLADVEVEENMDFTVDMSYVVNRNNHAEPGTARNPINLEMDESGGPRTRAMAHSTREGSFYDLTDSTIEEEAGSGGNLTENEEENEENGEPFGFHVAGNHGLFDDSEDDLVADSEDDSSLEDEHTYGILRSMEDEGVATDEEANGGVAGLEPSETEANTDNLAFLYENGNDEVVNAALVALAGGLLEGNDNADFELFEFNEDSENVPPQAEAASQFILHV